MRKDGKKQIAGPDDWAGDVYEAAGGAPFTAATVRKKKHAEHGYGGELRTAAGETFPFDGFDTKAALNDWLHKQFDIRPRHINTKG